MMKTESDDGMIPGTGMEEAQPELHQDLVTERKADCCAVVSSSYEEVYQLFSPLLRLALSRAVG